MVVMGCVSIKQYRRNNEASYLLIWWVIMLYFNISCNAGIMNRLFRILSKLACMQTRYRPRKRMRFFNWIWGYNYCIADFLCRGVNFCFFHEAKQSRENQFQLNESTCVYWTEAATMSSSFKVVLQLAIHSQVHFTHMYVSDHPHAQALIDYVTYYLFAFNNGQYI